MGFNEFIGKLFGNKATRDMKEIKPWVDKIKAAKLLLLDEPLTSLDVVVAEEMKQLLRSLKKDRIIIFSTHIMELALDLCDEIVILNHGELEVVDPSNLDNGGFKDKIIRALKEEEND